METADIIDEIIRYESSEFVNHPMDRGGPTKYGVTAATLGKYRNLNRPASIDEVKELTEEEARAIYNSEYVNKPGFDTIKNGVIRWVMVDAGVVHGIINPTNWLQTILGVKRDGIFGPETNKQLELMNPLVLVSVLIGARSEAIARLVTRDKTQLVFLLGWVNRTNDLARKAFLKLVTEKKSFWDILNPRK